MFTDKRSKKIIFLSHCILNQNSISDGTADFPGTNGEVLKLLIQSDTGIVQLPCPELLCLGLDRGNPRGSEFPVLIENTKIRKSLESTELKSKIKILVAQLIQQIEEYIINDFNVLGIIGIDRSPSCGVNTTSMNNKEVDGEGVFIKTLREELEKKNIHIKIIGIKASETDKALIEIKKLLGCKYH